MLEPVYPAIAKALSTGLIGAEHAAAIADTVEKIPVADRAAHAEQVETTLLEHARTSDPRTVTVLGNGSWRIWIRTVWRGWRSGCSSRTGRGR